ncbi:MAG: hypothetical protein A3C07_04180 [Candidatus Sungbacteria bacterium RIFCSPHIGHO2_02_FULL_47_11]|uniref:VanZ-like domain-containing protein n=1 Tax=Candidatus Sungbacteria bacterium RIFCSPHIGHO2_02_FULL_47_11 TaxID=1802270 RepID=A0A1G2KLG3_9BACT|nr:MAG: hypothetical protein A3C07_04180 [Candidatus Sungbacteria bacterium RIFCSPHIGHO2_02_FULL_47_11]
MKKQFNLFVLPGMLSAITLIVMFFFQRMNGLFVESIWYDKIMHIAGGAGACVLVFPVLANCPVGFRWAILRFGLPLVGLTFGLLVGLGWEGLERIFPIITDHILQGNWDTFFDVIFDCLGGYIAGKKYEEIWRWQLNY